MVGPVYYYNILTRKWITYGELGYCFLGQDPHLCTGWTNPQKVSGREGDDNIGASITDIVLCRQNGLYAIGPWSKLGTLVW